MTYIVDAVDEALGLLLLVAEQPSLGVSEIARRAGLTKARAFRLLTTLEHRGLIAREANAAHYKLGFNAMVIGNAAREQIDLVKVAGPFLAELGEACKENVVLRVRDNWESVCVARVESPLSVRVHTELGTRRPLHAGASGKLLLAYAPPDFVEAFLQRELAPYSGATITEPARLREQLDAIRAAGHSVSIGERNPEAIAVAAPLYDGEGQVVASLSIASPASRTQADVMARHIELVTGQAQALSRALGYRPR